MCKNNKTGVHQVCIECVPLKSLKMLKFSVFVRVQFFNPKYRENKNTVLFRICFMGYFPISDRPKFCSVLFIAFLIVDD